MKNNHIIEIITLMLIISINVVAQRKKIVIEPFIPKVVEPETYIEENLATNRNFFDSLQIKENMYKKVAVIRTKLSSRDFIKKDTAFLFSFDENGRTVQQIKFNDYGNDTINLIEKWNALQNKQDGEIIKYYKVGTDSVFERYELMNNNVDTAFTFIDIQNSKAQIVERHKSYSKKYGATIDCDFGASYDMYYKYDTLGRVSEFGNINKSKIQYIDNIAIVTYFDSYGARMNEAKYIIDKSNHMYSIVSTQELMVAYKQLYQKELMDIIWYVNLNGYTSNFDFVYY